MPFWTRLRTAYDALRGTIPPALASDTLPNLAARVAALEDIQTRREMEWAETKSALDRMLKRAAALDQRARERETPNGTHRSKDQLRELMRAKGYLPSKGE